MNPKLRKRHRLTGSRRLPVRGYVAAAQAKRPEGGAHQHHVSTAREWPPRVMRCPANHAANLSAEEVAFIREWAQLRHGAVTREPVSRRPLPRLPRHRSGCSRGCRYGRQAATPKAAETITRNVNPLWSTRGAPGLLLPAPS